jgi:hypothetical protein
MEGQKLGNMCLDPEEQMQKTVSDFQLLIHILQAFTGF